MGNTFGLAKPVGTMQNGVFDGIPVWGNLFDENGKRFWILDLIVESKENSYAEPTKHSYWVSGGEFRTVRGTLVQGYLPVSAFQFGEMASPSPAERRDEAAVTDVPLSSWESAARLQQ
jgi:hypothetical protein